MISAPSLHLCKQFGWWDKFLTLFFCWTAWKCDAERWILSLLLLHIFFFSLLSELLKLRNTLVHHLHSSVEKGADRSNLQRLPDILSNRQTCQYCPQKLNCALYERCFFFSAVSIKVILNFYKVQNITGSKLKFASKLYLLLYPSLTACPLPPSRRLHRPLRVLDPSSADLRDDVVRDFLQQESGHLAPQHLNYFSHWLLLCLLEAVTMETKNTRKHIWLQSIESRYGCFFLLRP